MTASCLQFILMHQVFINQSQSKSLRHIMHGLSDDLIGGIEFVFLLTSLENRMPTLFLTSRDSDVTLPDY